MCMIHHDEIKASRLEEWAGWLVLAGVVLMFVEGVLGALCFVGAVLLCRRAEYYRTPWYRRNRIT